MNPENIVNVNIKLLKESIDLLHKERDIMYRSIQDMGTSDAIKTEEAIRKMGLLSLKMQDLQRSLRELYIHDDTINFKHHG